MKDQFFKFSRLIFITSIALAILVGILAAFIALGGKASFHLTRNNQTIEAEVDQSGRTDPGAPDSVGTVENNRGK